MRKIILLSGAVLALGMTAACSTVAGAGVGAAAARP
ncbi:MAG: entericidin EcnA/B family protein [Alphaproteobacteria bacterium]